MVNKMRQKKNNTTCSSSRYYRQNRCMEKQIYTNLTFSATSCITMYAKGLLKLPKILSLNNMQFLQTLAVEGF